MQEAWNWSPVSAALVVVLWTGSKSLQFLSVPVYVRLDFPLEPGEHSSCC